MLKRALLYLTLGAIGMSLLVKHGWAEDPLVQQQIERGDFSQADYFVFVPLPCPSEAEYRKALGFMDLVVKRAGTKGNPYKVVVVRACYDDPSNLGHQQKDWWASQTKNLSYRYQDWQKDGTVIVVDSIPYLKKLASFQFEGTPWGFIFSDGHLLWHDYINVDDPEVLLKDIFTGNTDWTTTQ